MALLAINFNNIVVLIMFSFLQSRLKLLRTVLERNVVPVNSVGSSNVGGNIKTTRKCLYNYDRLLDNILIVDKELQYPIDIATTSNLIEIAENLYTLSSPAIIAELIRHEVDKIKSTLSKQLAKCTDESLRWELRAALQYITLRPFSYTICRVIPLNINLTFNLFSIIITYVIVLMQLTRVTA
ncbi:uncharacterized protein LOC142982359 [Anticarsia gemmatalis]|uniref:uncharacterized protein LOC142982359 n=1 Tax=Anticarsia gemmatalis TaxID=129554 RepID=UPI003F759E5F